jgi:hypothetical protein
MINLHKESIYLQGVGWEYYNHQRDKKGKLVSVKVNFIS